MTVSLNFAVSVMLGHCTDASSRILNILLSPNKVVYYYIVAVKKLIQKDTKVRYLLDKSNN